MVSLRRNRMYTGYYAQRFAVLERDEFTCRYCGQHAPNVPLEVDHVKPVIEGGTDDINNLITSCWACNRGKEGLRVRKLMAQKERGTRERDIILPEKITMARQIADYLIENPRALVRQIAQDLDFHIALTSVRLSKMREARLVTSRGRNKGWEIVP